nr:IS1 family transposase [Clostridium cuniculi]
MCGRTFTNEIYNQFRYSKKFKENYQEYLALLNKGLTIRECARKLNITVVTAFFWRHRFLFDLKNKYYVENISSYVELTKMVVNENFKGSRNITDNKRDKITIINAINDSIDILPIIAARNFFGFYEIRDNLVPRLNKSAYVVGLIDGRLKTFAKAFNEINKVSLEEKYKNNIDIQYSINTQKWLSKFRGVASKYLDHYLYWRLFEYKNNFELKKTMLSSKTMKTKIYLNPKITTYISWENIKSKTLPI